MLTSFIWAWHKLTNLKDGKLIKRIPPPYWSVSTFLIGNWYEREDPSYSRHCHFGLLLSLKSCWKLIFYSHTPIHSTVTTITTMDKSWQASHDSGSQGSLLENAVDYCSSTVVRILDWTSFRIGLSWLLFSCPEFSFSFHYVISWSLLCPN